MLFIITYFSIAIYFCKLSGELQTLGLASWTYKQWIKFNINLRYCQRPSKYSHRPYDIALLILLSAAILLIGIGISVMEEGKI